MYIHKREIIKPFERKLEKANHEELVNIVNGMHANSDMNVDESKEIGVRIVKEMHEKSPASHVQ